MWKSNQDLKKHVIMHVIMAKKLFRLKWKVKIKDHLLTCPSGKVIFT